MSVDAASVLHCTGNTFALRADVADGRIRLAASGGRMLRDPGVLLRTGSTSRGLPEFMERAHCLCGSAHALAAVRALEDLAGTEPPPPVQLARSLTLALRCMRDSLVHVYQFYLSDWIVPGLAAHADPVRTARLANAPGEDAAFFSRAQEALRAAAPAEGVPQDHPARRGTPEVHLLVKAHAMQALTLMAELGATLTQLEGGETGCPFLSVGGGSHGLEFPPETIRAASETAHRSEDFTRRILLPDLARLAGAYGDWTAQGRGGAHLCWGDLLHPTGEGQLFPAAACLFGRDEEFSSRAANPADVRECAGLGYDETDLPHLQWPGRGYRPLPAPRLDGRAWEMGPSARLLAAHAGGDETVCGVLREFMDATNLPLHALDSTLGRYLARGLESAVLSRCLPAWIDALASCPNNGRTVADTPWSPPASGCGRGLVEVGRGGLIHTIRVESGRINEHACLVPSLWNFSPRDGHGVPGPLEKALEGLAVSVPARPVEILRTIHAFAPCNACVVLVRDHDTGTTHTVTTQ